MNTQQTFKQIERQVLKVTEREELRLPSQTYQRSILKKRHKIDHH